MYRFAVVLLCCVFVTPAFAEDRPSAIMTAADVATCMLPDGGEWVVVAGTTQSASLSDGYEVFARVDLARGAPTLYLIPLPTSRYVQQRAAHTRQCAAAANVAVEMD